MVVADDASARSGGGEAGHGGRKVPESRVRFRVAGGLLEGSEIALSNALLDRPGDRRTKSCEECGRPRRCLDFKGHSWADAPDDKGLLALLWMSLQRAVCETEPVVLFNYPHDPTGRYHRESRDLQGDDNSLSDSDRRIGRGDLSPGSPVRLPLSKRSACSVETPGLVFEVDTPVIDPELAGRRGSLGDTDFGVRQFERICLVGQSNQ